MPRRVVPQPRTAGIGLEPYAKRRWYPKMQPFLLAEYGFRRTPALMGTAHWCPQRWHPASATWWHPCSTAHISTNAILSVNLV